MSFTSDMNLVDMFLNHDDPFLNTDDVFKSKTDQKDEMDWLSDEFLDSILKTNSLASPFKLSDSDSTLLDKPLPEHTNSRNYLIENGSDSGVSLNDQSLSPKIIEITDDSSILSSDMYFDNGVINETAIDNVFHIEPISNISQESNETNNDSSDDSIRAGEEVVECEEISLLNDDMVVTNVFLKSEKTVIDDVKNDDVFITELNSEDDEYIEIVNSSQSKPVLLKNSNKFKTLKFVGVKRPSKISFKSRRAYGKRDLSTDDAASDDSDGVYPRLTLTAEEKRLMIKEGITLPSHYPLTKSEEKDLKRIRRKIRNKISAQDSRRRKKEYVDGLEERVKKCSEENARLLSCIKRLQIQNVALVSQVRKLQASLGKNVTQPTTQPSTCLFVLFLSLALVLAPVLRNSTPMKNNITDDEGISLSDGENSVASGRSRNLLYAEAGRDGDVCSVGDEPKIAEDVNNQFDLPKLEDVGEQFDFSKLGDVGKHFDLSKLADVGNKQFDFSKLEDVLLPPNPVNVLPLPLEQLNTVYIDHDYFRSRKRSCSSIDSDSDDMWPTPPPSVEVNKTKRTRNI